MQETLKAPFPYFGGKSRVADVVWRRLGDVPNYVEPFFGSGAVLLARPHQPKTETVNDADGLLANFWRALQAAPEQVAEFADWPVNENDLHARHIWLVGQKENLQARLEGDPDYFDAKIAGWWVWGICCWIGSGWCSGRGPWRVVERDGVRRLERARDGGDGVWRQRPHLGDAGRGIKRKLPHLGSEGQGIQRQLPHLGNEGRGIKRKLPSIGDDGRGVHRTRPHLGNDSCGVNRQHTVLTDWFSALAERLRRVRVCCGDWARVCGPSVTINHGLTGVFLDPPYTSEADRDNDLYRIESQSVGHAACAWAIANGDNPLLRIALCGYEGEYDMPKDWECFAWKASGGYSSQNSRGNDNSHKERIWFSPYCIGRQQADLFDGVQQ